MAFPFVDSLSEKKGRIQNLKKALEILFSSVGFIFTMLILKGSVIPYSCEMVLSSLEGIGDSLRRILSSYLYIYAAIYFTILLVAASSIFHRLVAHDQDDDFDVDSDYMKIYNLNPFSPWPQNETQEEAIPPSPRNVIPEEETLPPSPHIATEEEAIPPSFLQNVAIEMVLAPPKVVETKARAQAKIEGSKLTTTSDSFHGHNPHKIWKRSNADDTFTPKVPNTLSAEICMPQVGEASYSPVSLHYLAEPSKEKTVNTPKQVKKEARELDEEVLYITFPAGTQMPQAWKVEKPYSPVRNFAESCKENTVKNSKEVKINARDMDKEDPGSKLSAGTHMPLMRQIKKPYSPVSLNNLAGSRKEKTVKAPKEVKNNAKPAVDKEDLGSHWSAQTHMPRETNKPHSPVSLPYLAGSSREKTVIAPKKVKKDPREVDIQVVGSIFSAGTHMPQVSEEKPYSPVSLYNSVLSNNENVGKTPKEVKENAKKVVDKEVHGINNSSRNEEEDTMEATWNAITGGGKEKPKKKELKKSETWEYIPPKREMQRLDSEEVVPSSPIWKQIRKSKTFDGALSITLRGGLIRRDPSMSLDDFNKKVDGFINKCKKLIKGS